MVCDINGICVRIYMSIMGFVAALMLVLVIEGRFQGSCSMKRGCWQSEHARLRVLKGGEWNL